jgi:hypothetical protein
MQKLFSLLAVPGTRNAGAKHKTRLFQYKTRQWQDTDKTRRSITPQDEARRSQDMTRQSPNQKINQLQGQRQLDTQDHLRAS